MLPKLQTSPVTATKGAYNIDPMNQRQKQQSSVEGSDTLFTIQNTNT